MAAEMKLDIMNYIPVGAENGITERHLGRILGCNTRMIRRMINDARENNIIVNTQDGSGFFVPDFRNKEDVQAYRKYVRAEEARAYSIKRSLSFAKEEAKKWGIHD